MTLIELLIIAVGLSMDAFAVAICKGLALKSISISKAGLVGLYFGVFQAGMPLLGYLLGSQFKDKITAFDHWIAFGLLGLIGISMVRESRTKECPCPSGKDSQVCSDKEASLSIKNMTLLAVATSIDALAVGVTFAFLKIDIAPAVSFIGVITFTLSVIGVKIGHVFGSRFKSKAELTGGVILMFMGVKILLEHTVFL